VSDWSTRSPASGVTPLRRAFAARLLSWLIAMVHRRHASLSDTVAPIGGVEPEFPGFPSHTHGSIGVSSSGYFAHRRAENWVCPGGRSGRTLTDASHCQECQHCQNYQHSWGNDRGRRFGGASGRKCPEHVQCWQSWQCSGVSKGIERCRSTHINASIGEGRGCIGVFPQFIDGERREITAGRDDDNGAGFGGEEDVSGGGNG